MSSNLGELRAERELHEAAGRRTCMVFRSIACALAILFVGCSTRSGVDATALTATEGTETLDPVCFDDGTCTTCTADGSCTQCTDDGQCTDCNEFYEVGRAVDTVPTTEGTDVDIVFAPPPPPPTYIIEILADGTGVIKDAAGTVIQTIKGFATRTAGGWVIRPTMVPDYLNGAKIIGRVAKCFGPIAALALIAELSYAGMDASLGDAAAKMGVRLKDCQERFTKVVSGIQCLLRQPNTTKCTDAVNACPDAIFGANLTMSCAAEPAFQELVDALAATIGDTGCRPGGWGTISPDPAHRIADAIKNGTFATDPSKVCKMRARVENCTFVNGDIFPSPAGFDEAKRCWEGASRGVFESKYEEALKCCTTAACRANMGLVNNC